MRRYYRGVVSKLKSIVVEQPLSLTLHACYQKRVKQIKQRENSLVTIESFDKLIYVYIPQYYVAII